MTSKQFAENNTVKAAKSNSISKSVAVWLVLAIIAIMLTAFYIGKVSGAEQAKIAIVGNDSLRYGQTAVFQAEVETDAQVKAGTWIVWEVDGEETKRGKFGEQDALSFEFDPLKVGKSEVSVTIGRTRKITAIREIEVLKPLLTVVVRDVEISYGDLTPSFEYEVTGFVDSDKDNGQVELLTDFDGKNVGEFKINAVPVNMYGKYDYHITAGKLRVGPKVVKLSADKILKTYDGTTKADVGGISLEGVLENDDVSVEIGDCSYVDKNAGENKIVTMGSLTLAGRDCGKYEVKESSLRGDILARELKISGIRANSKIFDGNNAASISSLGTVKGLVVTDKVSVEKIEARFVSSEVGEDREVVISSIRLSGEDCENYFVKTEGKITADIISGNWDISSET